MDNCKCRHQCDSDTVMVADKPLGHNADVFADLNLADGRAVALLDERSGGCRSSADAAAAERTAFYERKSKPFAFNYAGECEMKNMIAHMLGIKAASVAAGMKTLVVPQAIAFMLPVGAILAQGQGTISESTGIAIGVVGGLVCAASGGAWCRRGYLDGLKAEVKRVETNHGNDIENFKAEIKMLKEEIARLRKKLRMD